MFCLYHFRAKIHGVSWLLDSLLNSTTDTMLATMSIYIATSDQDSKLALLFFLQKKDREKKKSREVPQLEKDEVSTEYR